LRVKHKYIYYIPLIVISLIHCVAINAQRTIIYDVATAFTSKQVLLFNTNLYADSTPLINKAGKKLTEDEAIASEYEHSEMRFFTLFEADGSALLIDTGGYFYSIDNDDINAKAKPLHINIDTIGAGKKNIIIETSSQDLVHLKIFVIPYVNYKLSGGNPKVKTQLSLKLEEVIYGAKNKVPPRLLDEWNEQVGFIPENRKILYSFSVIFPPSMANRKGKKTLMVYDLSRQVVAIFSNLDKPKNTLHRENIMSKTYIYKLYFNDEEVKSGLLHFLSPEDEGKRKEAENAPPPTTEPENQEEKEED